jgi:AcrR family transcriptional regulator
MPPATTRLPASERREQLLDTTKAIVAERGFHNVSIEAVAREAGVSRPIVYGHFEHLSGLLEALVVRESRRALKQLSAVLPSGLEEPRAQLLSALRAYLETVEADPDTWRLVLMPPEGAPSLLRDLLARGRAAVLAQLAEAVRSGVGSGGPSPDPELTARTLSAIADESARLLLTEPERFPVERLVAHAGWVLEQLG